MNRRPTYQEWLASRYVPIAGAEGEGKDDGEGGTGEKKQLEEKIDGLRTSLKDSILDSLKGGPPSGEDKQEIERREKELGKHVDDLTAILKDRESDEVKELKSRLAKLEREPAGDRKGAQTRTMKDGRGGEIERKDYQGANFFHDRVLAAKGDFNLAGKLTEYESQFRSPEREKAWATGGLETNDLVLPDVQAALPFLAAEAKVVQLCRELRTTASVVEFPVYQSGLTVAVVPELGIKPAADPTFALLSARVYVVAGTTQVPNQTLEDYPVARGWIASELGRSTGVKEAQLVLSGTGTGEPLGFLNNTSILGDAVDAGTGATNGRNIITTLFKEVQKVRSLGFTEPTDIVISPDAWSAVAMAFEGNIGFLLGAGGTEVANAGAPTEQAKPRLLGLPVTQSPYLPANLGAGTNETVIVVGNFQDAVVLRRSPFRVDVDTSLGFRDNSTWFRGEERMGFIVPRPASFRKITGLTPAKITV